MLAAQMKKISDDKKRFQKVMLQTRQIRAFASGGFSSIATPFLG